MLQRSSCCGSVEMNLTNIHEVCQGGINGRRPTHRLLKRNLSGKKKKCVHSRKIYHVTSLFQTRFSVMKATVVNRTDRISAVMELSEGEQEIINL